MGNKALASHTMSRYNNNVSNSAVVFRDVHTDAIVYMSRGRLVIYAARLEGKGMRRKSLRIKSRIKQRNHLSSSYPTIITGLYLCQLHASHKNRASFISVAI